MMGTTRVVAVGWIAVMTKSMGFSGLHDGLPALCMYTFHPEYVAC